MKDKKSQNNKTHWKKELSVNNFFQKKGSAAVLLSLIVSGSVAATIFVSQSTMMQFLSARSQTQDNWQTISTAQYGLHLGSYLVSNNLILCREGGWSGIQSRCQWTFNSKSQTASHFKLSKKKYVTIPGKNRQALQYTGKHTIEGKEYKYSISFDLLPWKDSQIQGLVGNIPESFCRNANTLQIINGKCNPKTKHLKCKTNDGITDIANSYCEYISSMDQDVMIVLMTATVSSKDHSTVKHAAIRRPLAQISIAVTDPARCELSCASGYTLLFPECRGNMGFPNLAQKGNSKMTIQVTNKGPGTIYALQLNRKDTRVDVDCTKNDAPSPCPPYARVVTTELLQQSNKEALLPNEYIIFEDLVDCSQQNIYNIQTSVVQRVGRRWGTTTSTQTTRQAINPHGQDFLQVKYSLFANQSLSNSPGVCMDSSDPTIPASQQLIRNANCPANYMSGNGKACRSGSRTGVCRYSHIEPRRIFAPDTAEISGTSKKFKTITNQVITVIQYIVPH